MELTSSITLGFIRVISPVTFVVLLGLGLLLWGLKNPLAWLVLSVLLITAGVGCAVYGITNLSALNVHPAPGVQVSSREIQEAASYVGFGAGGTVGGAVLLVVTLLRRKKGPGSEPQT